MPWKKSLTTMVLETSSAGWTQLERGQSSGADVYDPEWKLDGSPLLIDEKGHFSTELVLPVGGAILSLTATDRFGKTESVRRTIFVP
jgi:hypothetical protein